MYCNNVTSKSREQRLITKEHIATHTNLIILFKPALYSIAEVLKIFKSPDVDQLDHPTPVNQSMIINCSYLLQFTTLHVVVNPSATETRETSTT